ncbi:MAG: polysaccharide export protein, partial [Pyrinomonadaceae bacterium]|nr:polysaccharide export protein [Phycisphaerales bacterium]
MSQVGTQQTTMNSTSPRHGRNQLGARPRAAWLVMAAGGLALGGVGGLGGCEVDSYMDPSVTGYWEHTPTIVPILDHIAAIDDVPQEEVETTPPTREDLIAEAQEYRIGPSDELEIAIENFFQAQRNESLNTIVDQRGYINLPKVGSVYVLGKTQQEVAETVTRAIRDAQILNDPRVLVIISAQRQQTFSITGGVRNPSSYYIPKPDYRVLEAITAAGGMDETAQKLYVIRQVPLSDEATGRTSEPVPTTPTKQFDEAAPPLKPGKIDDIMNDILNPPKTRPAPGAEPAKPPVDKPAGTAGSPGSMGSRERAGVGARARQPEGQPAKKKVDIDLIDSTGQNEPIKSPPEPGS